LNGTHHFLLYVDDIKLLGKKLKPKAKYRKAASDARKEDGLEQKVVDTKYVHVPSPDFQTGS